MNVVVNPITVHPVSMRQNPFNSAIDFVDGEGKPVAKLCIERQHHICKISVLDLATDIIRDTSFSILNALHAIGYENASSALEELMMDNLTALFAQANMAVDWSVIHDPITEAEL